MADNESRESSASAVMKPLTQMSLSGLVGKKRKRAQVDIEDADIVQVQPARRFAPAKKPRKKPADPTLREILGGSSSVHTISSAYLAHPPTNNSRYDLVKLQYAFTLINKCVAEGNERHFSNLRDKLNELEADPHLNVKALIDASKLLSAKGLPRIFAGLDVFPWDIKVDAENLYKRWMKGDLDVSLMKGIEVTKKKTVSYKLEKSYKDKISAHTFGANGLTNGDWWLLRVGALRDGAHGAIEAGIHGKSGHGAYSIVLAAGGYADEDNGEIIQYCGTASDTSKLTSCTTFLRESLLNQKPIRVLRSATNKSIYAPADGIRYDGLYVIKAEEVLDLDTGMYRFTLERLPDQDPIRYQGPEKRPTKEQLLERDFVRNLINGVART